MKRIAFLASCLALTACNSLSGKLTVTSAAGLQIKDSKGELVTLNSGDAKLSMNGNNEIDLQIKDSRGKNDTFKLKSVSGDLPKNDGTHLFPATSTGLMVDIEEVVTTQHVKSEPITQNYDCKFPRERNICKSNTPTLTTDPTTGLATALPTAPNCVVKIDEVPGTHSVTTGTDQTVYLVELKLTDPSTGLQVADFLGDTYDAKGEVLSAGPCQPRK